MLDIGKKRLSEEKNTKKEVKKKRKLKKKWWKRMVKEKNKKKKIKGKKRECKKKKNLKLLVINIIKLFHNSCYIFINISYINCIQNYRTENDFYSLCLSYYIRNTYCKNI